MPDVSKLSERWQNGDGFVHVLIAANDKAIFHIIYIIIIVCQFFVLNLFYVVDQVLMPYTYLIISSPLTF